FDVVINATAASLQGEVPPLPDSVLAKGACCYDMMYSDKDTAFIQWAKAHSAAKTIDGLGMLVEQAAEAFHIWRGVRPQTASVIALLREAP
ncbi:MAG TPA: shikimate dehydrogenase, partial [Methylophaga sp.]|nr:shikimate dehydrogenase [Methylophaga sp.]